MTGYWFYAAVESPNAAVRNQALAHWRAAPVAAGPDRGHRNFNVLLGQVVMAGSIFEYERQVVLFCKGSAALAARRAPANQISDRPSALECKGEVPYIRH